ncbi:hypothetical protein [Nitrosopumilus sp.]|uniref:hypothetical protein n=1 Tax=Nitrosopumilus sp. TaxID=2024843 RepID=UPI0034A0AB3E
MDNFAIKHLQDLYGLNPNIPHMTFQFPRLPPGLTNPMFKIHENPMKEQFLQNASTINQKLQGFQHMYQQYASGLLSMNSNVIPPGHPLYTRQNSIEMLQNQNDKLLQENLELKKKLQKDVNSK